jgi:hypothetical protein
MVALPVPEGTIFVGGSVQRRDNAPALGTNTVDLGKSWAAFSFEPQQRRCGQAFIVPSQKRSLPVPAILPRLPVRSTSSQAREDVGDEPIKTCNEKTKPSRYRGRPA